MYNQVPPYVYEMVDGDIYSPVRFSIAYGMEKAKSSIFSFMPMNCWNNCFAMNSYVPVANFFLDPSFAMWQVNNSMQNGMFDITCGSGCNFGFGGTGAGGFSDFGMSNIGPMGGMTGSMPGMGGMGGVNPWGFPTAGNAGGSGASGKTPAEAQAQTEYNELAKSIKSIMNIKGLDASTKTALQSALNTKGSVQEKKAALKEAVNQIGSDVLQEYVLLQNRADLDKIGYNFGAKSLSHADTENWKSAIGVTVGKFIEDLQSELKQGKDIQSISMIASPTENYKYLIPSITHWNRNNSEHMIQYITKGFSSKDEDGKRRVLLTIDTLCKALCDKARRLSSSTPQLDSARTNLRDALDKLDMKNYKASQENINKIAAAFDNLYGQIRMVEAQNLRNKIMTTYSDLGIIDENFIVADVQNDLKNEKISCSYDKIAPKKKKKVAVKSQESELDKKSADDQIKTLTNNKTLTKTNNEDIYKSNEGKYYTKAEDKDGNETLSEVQGVTSISEDGKINGKYETVADAQDAKAVTTKKRTASYVQNIENTKKLIQTLYDKHLMHQDGGKLISNYRDENNNLVYYTIDEYGQLVNKANNNVILSEDDVPNENTFKDASAVRQVAAGEGETPKINASLASDSASDKGYEELPVIGYYKKGSAYYKKVNGEYEYLPNVKSITSTGKYVDKNDGKTYALREDEDPARSGATLRKKIQNYGASTNYSEYECAYRKMCSFASYDSPDDIMAFIEGYENSLSGWYWSNNQHLCSQISTEDGATKGGKKIWTVNDREWMLRIIAKKLLIVVRQYNLFSKDDDEYRDLVYYATKAGLKDSSGKKHGWKVEGASWWHTTSMFNSERTGAANNMDNIIAKIRKKYKEQIEGK